DDVPRGEEHPESLPPEVLREATGPRGVLLVVREEHVVWRRHPGCERAPPFGSCFAVFSISSGRTLPTRANSVSTPKYSWRKPDIRVKASSQPPSAMQESASTWSPSERWNVTRPLVRVSTTTTIRERGSSGFSYTGGWVLTS